MLPGQHPWAQEGSAIPLQVLEGKDLIWREPGSGIREAVQQAARRLDIDLAIRYEFSGHAAIREGVRSGLGLGFSSFYRSNLPDDLRLLHFDPPIPHRLAVLFREDANPATHTLLQSLRSHLRGADA